MTSASRTGGYARFGDGRILVFQADNPEPTRMHPMQLWQTPFSNEEHMIRAAAAQGFWGRIGNPGLVRGIAELATIARRVSRRLNDIVFSRNLAKIG
ncbi:MAG: DNA repair ATPase [Azoarcus sp.]|jgi:hypothetical protein|nr:DNA repair ATPase [Azoarcus sp.]